MTETKRRCYLAGPISKVDWQDAKKQFARMAEYAIMELGFSEVVNPVDHQGPDCPDELCEMEIWTHYMRESLRKLTSCDGILLAPNYQLSKGARLERYVASEIGCTEHHMPRGFRGEVF